MTRRQRSGPAARVGEINEPIPYCSQLSVEIARGHQSSGGSAFIDDAHVFQGGRFNRDNSLFPIHGAERKDPPFPPPFRRLVPSPHAPPLPIPGTTLLR